MYTVFIYGKYLDAYNKVPSTNTCYALFNSDKLLADVKIEISSTDSMKQKSSLFDKKISFTFIYHSF